MFAVGLAEPIQYSGVNIGGGGDVIGMHCCYWILIADQLWECELFGYQVFELCSGLS
jgi:hypothetical protein